jgi:hypothetical protein
VGCFDAEEHLMTFDTRTCVPARQRQPDRDLRTPVDISFTRFVAAHGGTDSLRAAQRPAQTVSLNPLTFTRHQWLAGRPPSLAGANGETV